MEQSDRPETSPTDDVKYDEAALRDAEKKMHVSESETPDDPDPEGGHDPAALKDAEKKMGIEE